MGANDCDCWARGGAVDEYELAGKESDTGRKLGVFASEAYPGPVPEDLRVTIMLSG